MLIIDASADAGAPPDSDADEDDAFALMLIQPFHLRLLMAFVDYSDITPLTMLMDGRC